LALAPNPDSPLSSTAPALQIDRVLTSPNSGPRRSVDGWVGVRNVVLHYTGMQSADAAIARLCDPSAEVSAHYLVHEDGRILQLVDESLRAWHAGVSYWRGLSDLNSVSIGIELVNPGHEFGYRSFPPAQITALNALLGDIIGRYALTPEDVIGHSDIAPGRKQDPGELFPWQSLAGQGFGLWPNAPRESSDVGIWRALSGIGYAVPAGPGAEILDPETGAEDVISAFQRRFRPGRVDGVADAETRGLIAAVAELARNCRHHLTG
jgi:N-acetylmuramoyl-L-alanine amidase